VATALGTTVETFWESLLRGDNGISTIQSFDASMFRAHFGGEMRDWDPTRNIDPNVAKKMDRFAQYALFSAVDAVADSGIDFSKEDSWRCGAILGTGIGGLYEIETQHTRLIEKGANRISAFTVPKLMPNAGAGNISIQFGLRGMNTTVATACASATNAIGDAMRAIWFDDCDVMITGGSEASLTQIGLGAFAALRALSERNDDPAHASRPFDIDRDGFVLGEGGAALVIEELQHAKARGARIYCELLGYGASADAYHITQPSEDGIGASRAIELALRSAGLNPTDIDYVNAHGTSTPLGDIAETVTLKRVFGDHAYQLNVSSTKSMIGHLLGGSGAVEMIATVKTLQHGVIPATINIENQDPKCDLNYTANQPAERKVKYALKNSFGFGGHNGCLVVGQFEG